MKLDPNFTLFQALVSEAALALGATSAFQYSDSAIVDWMDNENPPTDEALNSKIDELKLAYDAQAYARNRKSEYDALNQLELMTDDAANSTTSHATAIGVIKTKWPKDNSGPVE
jgi:hypothetical protein|tara:strand:- start:13 stop:354 length:342 start_codon:yes stop_codon:yes gene_type:complete